jgi:ABC-type dipeptide/oligopeptide/nickel transport system ATPase component
MEVLRVGPSVRPASDTLLEVRDLRTHFKVMDGIVKAVDGVDFSLKRGQALGLVGESGCGKSVTALTIMQLIDTPPGEIVGCRGRRYARFAAMRSL